MKTCLLPLALVAFVPLAAQAATQPPAPGVPMADITGGKNLTCATFSKLGETAAMRVVYYVDGYAAGVEDQIAAGTPDSNPSDNKKLAPSAGPSSTLTSPTPTTAAANASASSGDGIGSMASISSVTIDQLRSLCEAKPSAKVLSLVPGGAPVSGSGTLTGTTGASGTTGTSGTAGSAVTSGGGNTAVNANLGKTTPGASGTGTLNSPAITTPGTTTPGMATGTTNGTATTMPSTTSASPSATTSTPATTTAKPTTTLPAPQMPTFGTSTTPGAAGTTTTPGGTTSPGSTGAGAGAATP